MRSLTQCTRTASFFTLLAYVSACHSWRAAPVAPQQVLAQQPKEVRVTQTNGSRLVLKQPTVAGDTLRGIGKGGETFHLPLQQVRSIEVKQGDTGKTVLLVVGTTVVVAGVATAIIVNYLSNID